MTFIFIGMPGSGKSNMSKAAARKLKMTQIECDRLIEKRAGKKLQEIINEDGLEYFRKLEEEILCSIEAENAIISTGGSAIYYPRAMEHFKKIGKVVYLYASLPCILERIGDFSRRGIVMAEGQTMLDLYEERCRLYEQYADATVNCDGRNYQKIHNRVEQTLRAFLMYSDENQGVD